mmetsp:Transcript_30976/g.88812  ORF Transcript_30976/g.88812 Transcript_30976/m.88812 type:complete len:151 (+) Transcript_30976:88-540(+)
MAAPRQLLGGLLAALALAGGAAAESGREQASARPLRQPHLPQNLLAILGQGGRRLLSLAEESARAAARAALAGDRSESKVAMAPAEQNSVPRDATQLPRTVAVGAAAAGAVAGMAGWDRTELGLWLAQTGMDGYKYQMNVWGLIGSGMPY